jgi:hypothetical protein
VPLNLSINYAKTPKELSSKASPNNNDKLNLSVDIVKPKANTKIKYPVHEVNSLRLSRITEEKLNNSVNDISSSKASEFDIYNLKSINDEASAHDKSILKG